MLDLNIGKIKIGGHKIKISIPIYDIASVLSGFYVGYNEAKGTDIGVTKEYLFKYGPTVFALAVTPLMIKALNSFGKFTVRSGYKSLETGDLKIKSKDGHHVRINDLKPQEKQIAINKFETNLKDLESKLENPEYLKPILKRGTITAVETFTGYIIGNLYGKLQ